MHTNNAYKQQQVDVKIAKKGSKKTRRREKRATY